MTDRSPAAEWPPTRWTLVCRCGALPPGERQAELGRLVETYRAPIESALARILTRHGVSPARARGWAEELAADFVADRWVAGDMLSRVDRHGPARFKTLLWKCLSDYAIDALRGSSRRERLARCAPAPRDPGAEAAQSFERTLALHDLRTALLETREWCAEKGWQDTFRAFCDVFLDGGGPDRALPERTWRDRCARIRARLSEALDRRMAAGCGSAEECTRERARVEQVLLDLRGVRWSRLLADGGLEVADG